MPVLSLHNTYSLPSGSASYTLGLSGAPGASSYTYPSVGQSSTALGLSSVLGGAAGLSSVGLGPSVGGHSSLLSSGLGVTGLNLTSNLGGGASALTSLGLGYNTSSYSTYTNPLITSGAMKLKTLDDFDIGISRFNRIGLSSPCSPIPPSGWGLDSYGIDGINPGFMHSQSRPLSRLGGLDGLDGELSSFIPPPLSLSLSSSTKRKEIQSESKIFSFHFFEVLSFPNFVTAKLFFSFSPSKVNRICCYFFEFESKRRQTFFNGFSGSPFSLVLCNLHFS